MDKSVVVLRNVGHGVNDIFWYILPSLLPVILDQFGMKYGTAGGLLTAFLGVVAVFSLILGKISDYFPRHIILGTGFFVASYPLYFSLHLPSNLHSDSRDRRRFLPRSRVCSD